jgi:hypothetical protein
MNRIFTSIALALIALAAVTGRADAKAVQITGPTTEVMHHNRVVRVVYLDGVHYRIRLADHSRWRLTMCATETERNCLWAPNPHFEDNRRFANIHGHRHYFAKGTYVPVFVS